MRQHFRNPSPVVRVGAGPAVPGAVRTRPPASVPGPSLAAPPPPSRARVEPVNAFITRVKHDPKIASMYQALQRNANVLDLPEFERELFHYQTDRHMRRPNVAKEILGDSQRVLITIDAQLSSQRSRANEIRMHCYKVHDTLDEWIGDATNYLLATYATELGNSGYSSRESRSAAVEFVLAGVIKRRRELSRVMRLAEMVMDDIDKSSFVTGHAVKVLEIGVAKGRL